MHRLSPATERILALKVGKTCVVSQRPDGLMRRVKQRLPNAKYSQRAVDGQYVITRIA
jgi:hypothetical protein